MNSVVWNSFITAFETMEKSDLTLLREITSILVMSPSIIDNPNETEIFSVISPDIDPKIIIHMLRNVNVDGVVLNSNDFKTICAKMNVDETAKYNPVKPFVVKDLNINNDELNLKDWCSAYVITTLREYPFLRSYAKKKQMI